MFMVFDSLFIEIIRDYYTVHCLIGARDGTSFTKSRRGCSPRGRYYIYWMELLTVHCFEYSSHLFDRILQARNVENYTVLPFL